MCDSLNLSSYRNLLIGGDEQLDRGLVHSAAMPSLLKKTKLLGVGAWVLESPLLAIAGGELTARAVKSSMPDDLIGR